MFGNNKNYPKSPLRSPNISTSKKSGFHTIGSKKLSNKFREKLEEAINMTSLPDTAKENIRNNQNPNNAIFIDEKNKKVYKFGLWLDRERCIRNEFIAYTLLLKENGDGMNIHYPEMFDCQKIEGTKYAMLTLEYIPDIQMVCFPSKKNNQNMNVIKNNKNNNLSKCIDSLNNTSRNNLINDGCQYLNNVGIKHNDEEQNLFYHIVDNQMTFLWMDFEAATFDKNKLNMCSKLLLQKNVKISHANSTNMSPIFMENLHSPSSSTKKRKKENNNANNGNYGNYMFNRLAEK